MLKEYQALEEYKGKFLDVEVRTGQKVPEAYKTLVSQKITYLPFWFQIVDFHEKNNPPTVEFGWGE